MEDATALPDGADSDVMDASPHATDARDAPRERPPIPDAFFDEEGGLQGQEIPPRGHAALFSWLNFGRYRSWTCQRNPRRAPIPSEHAFTRICMNAQWINTESTEVFPVGSAAVKELYESNLRTISGFAVMLKVGPGNTPADWYWYQRVRPDSMNPALPEPITPEGVVADGLADRPGNAFTICASCHSTAGEVGRSGHHYGFTTGPEQ